MHLHQHKADFHFDYLSNGDIAITVKTPNTGTAFFSATVTPSKRLPSFRLRTDWLPISLDLLQPPLPAVDEIATSTEKWQKTPFSILQQKAQIAYIKPALEIEGSNKRYADGENFPDIAPLSAGMYCKDAVIDFKAPFTPEVVSMPAASAASLDGRSKRD